MINFFKRLFRPSFEKYRMKKLQEHVAHIETTVNVLSKEYSRMEAILADTCNTISECNDRIKKLENQKKARVGRPKSKKVNEDNANKARKPNN